METMCSFEDIWRELQSKDWSFFDFAAVSGFFIFKAMYNNILIIDKKFFRMIQLVYANRPIRFIF